MPTRRKKEWFDNEALWRDTFTHIFSPARFAAAAGEAVKIITLTKPSGKAVLDLCCGPGRFSVPLAKLKYRVTGVDRTQFLLRRAKSLAGKSRVNIEFIKQDMRDFVRPESFDLAVNMLTSFGYFDKAEENMQVLENIWSSLRPGGKVLIDVMGKERLAKIFLPSDVVTLPDGSRLVEIREVRNDWTRMHNEWIRIRRGRARSYQFDHWIYSGQEMKDMLRQVGFIRVQLYGNLDGAPYGPDSMRLIAIGQKPGERRRRVTLDK